MTHLHVRHDSFICETCLIYICKSDLLQLPVKWTLMSSAPLPDLAGPSFFSDSEREVGGWGRDPKKCTGKDWRMGSSTIQWNLHPVVKYHLRRGVGFMKFLENGSRPQPPTSRRKPSPFHPWVFMNIQIIAHRVARILRLLLKTFNVGLGVPEF